MLVGVNHLGFQPCNWAISLLLSYHTMLQVWYNPWIRDNFFHSKFSVRRSFGMGSLLVWFFYCLPRLEENNASCKASYYVMLSIVEGDNVDVQPTPIVKLSQVREYAQLLSNFVVEHLLEFLVTNVMNTQSFMDKLSKMSISNINKHHQKAIDSYFRSVWHHHGTIFFLISKLSDIVSIFLQ